MAKQTIEIEIEEGDMILGYVAAIKVLDANGEGSYWIDRARGVNIMESLGMSRALSEIYAGQLRAARTESDE